MQLTSFADIGNGLFHGVVRCLEGHVHLRNLPAAEQPFYERLFRRFADAQPQLPPKVQDVVSFLDTFEQLKRDDFNDPHIGFTPVQQLTDEVIEAAIATLTNTSAGTLVADGEEHTAELSGQVNPNGEQLGPEGTPPAQQAEGEAPPAETDPTANDAASTPTGEQPATPAAEEAPASEDAATVQTSAKGSKGGKNVSPDSDASVSPEVVGTAPANENAEATTSQVASGEATTVVTPQSDAPPAEETATEEGLIASATEQSGPGTVIPIEAAPSDTEASE